MKSTLLALALSTGFAAAGALPPPPAPTAVPPPPAPAATVSGFNYNFLELGWIHNDIDIIGEGDGYYAGLSLSPVDHLILFANWDQIWGDLADTRRIVVGAGGYVPLCKQVDLVVRAGFQWMDADVAEIVTVDQNAFVSTVGLRIAITDWLEFAPAYRFQVADGDTYHSAVGSLLFDIGTDVQLAINGLVDDNETAFGAGIRYNF
jgi:hypothetical protein